MTTYKLFWLREDKQGDYDMGTFASREEAEQAIPDAKRELLDVQGSEPWMTAEIEAGSFQIVEVEK